MWIIILYSVMSHNVYTSVYTVFIVHGVSSTCTCEGKGLEPCVGGGCVIIILYSVMNHNIYDASVVFMIYRLWSLEYMYMYIHVLCHIYAD